MIELAEGVFVSPDELVYRCSRGGGSGGQHVNKVSTRVELSWGLATSPSLDEKVRERLLEAFAHRLDAAGAVRLVASRQRSQLANRREALERLKNLVEAALRPETPRIATKVSRNQKRRRVEAKRRRGDVKRSRRSPRPDLD